MDAQELHIVLLSNDPMRTYPALSLALWAAAMGAKARIYCTTTGLDLVRKGAADNVRLPGFPPLGQLLRDAIAQGVDVCACAPPPPPGKPAASSRSSERRVRWPFPRRRRGSCSTRRGSCAPTRS